MTTLKQIMKWLSKNQCYVEVLVGWMVCLFVKSYIDKFLSLFSSWLSLCTRNIAVILVIGLSIILSYRCLKGIYNKRIYTAHRKIAFYTFFVGIYVYYRFFDITFVFWTINIGIFKLALLDFLLIPFIDLLILKCLSPKRSSKGSDISNVLLDSPISDSSQDILGYSSLVDALVSDLSVVDVSKTSYSVGISGTWGLGKSSFLNILSKQVENSGDICMVFCPRASKSVSNIQDDFFRLFAQKLRPYHTGMNYLIKNYIKELSLTEGSWIGSIALLWTHLTDRKDEKEQINKAIREIERRIYVIVEDLDRLTGEEIVEVFKLIDRNGGFTNTIFLTAYDKNYINSVLKKYLGHSETNDYSDKYFNYEYTLPVQSPGVLTSYVDRYLTNILSYGDIDSQTDTIINSWHSCSRLITNHLTTLRHIKRYLNILMSRYPNVKKDVDIRDFMLLTLIRYKNIELYHAIVNGVIVHAGGSMFDPRKGVFLNEDYREILKKSDRYDSSLVDVLENLFFKKDDSPSCIIDYGRIRWLNSFDVYFYDYKPTKLYYKDLSALYNAKQNESFESIDRYVASNNAIDLEEFLISRTPNWITAHGGIEKHMCLMSYLDHKSRSMNLEASIGWMFNEETFEEYKKSGFYEDKAHFKTDIDKAIISALDIAPMEIGFICQRRLQSFYQDPNLQQVSIFTLKEIQVYAEWAQKYYYQHYGKPDFSFEGALNLTYIPAKINDEMGVSIVARTELKALMCLHADYFAGEIVNFRVNEVDSKWKLFIRLIDNFRIEQIFPIEGYRFTDWIKDEINDYSTVNLLSRLYESRNKGEYVLEVPALQQEYAKGDFDAAWKAVARYDDSKLDAGILAEIEKGTVYDLSDLCHLTESDVNQVRSSLKRLIAENKINKKYSHLREKIAEFVSGDIIRLTEEKFSTIQNEYIFKENLFALAKIEGDYAILHDIEETVSKSDLLPVLLDSPAAKHIYHDPVLAASIIGPNDEIPSHITDHTFFLDSFDHCMYERKTFNELMKGENFLYVHEVQHWLREHFNSDFLKINKTIDYYRINGGIVKENGN